MNETPEVQEPSAAVSAVARWTGIPASDINGFGVVIGAVLIGVMTRRALAATRNEKSPKLWIEILLLPVEVIIALVAQRGAGASGVMATIIAVIVGHGGARLVGAFLTSSEDRVMAAKPATTPILVPPSGADPDQDLIDKLKDTP